MLNRGLGDDASNAGRADAQADGGNGVFLIEDERHADFHGQYATFDDALAELRRRASISWNELPNRAPCTSWEACGRSYEIREYDDTGKPWKLIRSTPIVEIDAAGVRWKEGFREYA